ncbi:MAG: zf-HC2 domain-containing protein [Planctomycetes bacterium]|nr:zf-HC2 domain-containing protein [Planctomycetota bacterium]
MKCADVERLLDSLVAGDLTTATEARVGEHLRQCPACSRKAEQGEQLRAGLRALRKEYEQIEPPFIFSPSETVAVQRPVWKIIRAANWAAVAAAAVIGGLVVLLPRTSEPEKPVVWSDSGAAVSDTDLARGASRRRTPSIWLPLARTGQVFQGPRVRVPHLSAVVRPAERKGQFVGYRTPSLIINKKRSESGYEDPHSCRDHNDGVLDHGPAGNRMG